MIVTSDFLVLLKASGRLNWSSRRLVGICSVCFLVSKKFAVLNYTTSREGNDETLSVIPFPLLLTTGQSSGLNTSEAVKGNGSTINVSIFFTLAPTGDFCYARSSTLVSFSLLLLKGKRICIFTDVQSKSDFTFSLGKNGEIGRVDFVFEGTFGEATSV